MNCKSIYWQERRNGTNALTCGKAYHLYARLRQVTVRHSFYPSTIHHEEPNQLSNPTSNLSIQPAIRQARKASQSILFLLLDLLFFILPALKGRHFFSQSSAWNLLRKEKKAG
jgi:hypothetical protein